MLKKCLMCGKEFKTSNRKRKFCGKECYGKSIRTSVLIKCKVCEKEFMVEQNKLKKGRKFCSRECMGVFERGKPSGMTGKKQSKYYHKVMDGREPWNKGTKGIMKKNNGSFKKCHKAWNKGIPFSKEVRAKMSANKRDDKNANWKGDNAKYGTIHDWVRTRKGKAREHICEICNERQAMDWSNKDHKYKRDLEDWQAVCRKCHYKYDKINNNK